MKKSMVHVTDHAVIRYLELVCGVDTARIRAEIGTRVDRAVSLEAGAAVVGGFVYLVAGNTVTTIRRASCPNIRTGRQRRERAE